MTVPPKVPPAPPIEELYNARPEQLRRYDRWMGTRFAPRKDGKLNKPPYRVREGTRVAKAAKNDPENWATFEEAHAALMRGDVDAIGFVTTEEDPFAVIDLDGVIDPDTGAVDLLASRIVEDFPTYWEISASGTGLHGVCVGSKPGERCKKDPVELYDGHAGARFVVLTGETFGSGRDDVRDCSEQVNALYREMFPEKQKKARATPPPSGDRRLGREELLEKARSARSGARFRRLFDDGDTSGYESASNADYALINDLIFWTRGDADMVVDLFKASALYRPPPEKDRGYVWRSVKKALAGYTGSYHQPRSIEVHNTPEPESPLAPYLRLLVDPSVWTGRKGASAYKAFSALVILATENGIATDSGQLRIGSDVRTIAERAGIEAATLCRSTLPYLVQELKLVRWRKGKGTKAGEFILLPHSNDNTKANNSSVYSFSVVTASEILGVVTELIRMRGGRSKYAEVARLGPLAMMCFVVLATNRGGMDPVGFAERTGRRKDNVRRKLRELVAVGIVKMPREDFYALPLDFWKRHSEELERSGITEAEHRQKERHEGDRIAREADLRRRKHERAGNVYEMHPSMGKQKRRGGARRPAAGAPGDGSVTRIAARHEKPGAKTWRRDDELTPEQASIQEEYDHKVERCMDRLGEVFT